MTHSSSAAIALGPASQGIVAEDDAYYLNNRVPAVAFIAKGVRLPAGKWIRLADASAPGWLVEEVLARVFPRLKGTVVRLEELRSAVDVKEFEASLRVAPR